MRTTGQLFLHSWRHFLGLHLSWFTIAILVFLSAIWLVWCRAQATQIYRNRGGLDLTRKREIKINANITLFTGEWWLWTFSFQPVRNHLATAQVYHLLTRMHSCKRSDIMETRCYALTKCFTDGTSVKLNKSGKKTISKPGLAWRFHESETDRQLTIRMNEVAELPFLTVQRWHHVTARLNINTLHCHPTEHRY